MDVAYSPTGREFVAGSYDRTLRIFGHSAGHSREVCVEEEGGRGRRRCWFCCGGNTTTTSTTIVTLYIFGQPPAAALLQFCCAVCSAATPACTYPLPTTQPLSALLLQLLLL